jgi:hypothetical protein
MAGSCEHRNKLSGIIKIKQFLGQLGDYKEGICSIEFDGCNCGKLFEFKIQALYGFQL